jgi:hypothetical protein
VEPVEPKMDKTLSKLKNDLESAVVEKDRLLLEQEEKLLNLTDQVSELT